MSEGRSPDKVADFRNAMRRLATTVNIVTSSLDGEWYGMTATAVTSVSMDPCALLVCINGASAFHDVIGHAGRFCVNLLDASQSDLSRAFSGKLRGIARFDVGSWAADPGGLPFLVDGQASLFCDVDATLPYRTHTIFVGRVEGVRCSPRISPLIYQDGGYAVARPLG